MPVEQRLVVAWQHPETRAIFPIGVLSIQNGNYRFWYVQSAFELEGFRPLLGFEDFTRVYESTRLFPLFAQRVMDPRRPDYERYVESLRLPLDATPWEQLARSEGKRVGDMLQLLPEPTVTTDGRTECVFLVHGIRHLAQEDPSLEQRLQELRDGDLLRLLDEPDNAYNPRALLTANDRCEPLGWVPDLLLDYVHDVRTSGPHEVFVEAVNGTDAPAHLRLLARLSGRLPGPQSPFHGPKWDRVTR
jgi:hypothetical protein